MSSSRPVRERKPSALAVASRASEAEVSKAEASEAEASEAEASEAEASRSSPAITGDKRKRRPPASAAEDAHAFDDRDYQTCGERVPAGFAHNPNWHSDMPDRAAMAPEIRRFHELK
jgi:hypothetical protein